MTSRERVLNTIENKPVDRMPIDLGVHPSTGISMFAYWNLREYLGLSTDNIEVVDPVQLLARVDVDILEKFHCDCINLHPGWKNPYIWNPRGQYKFKFSNALIPKQNESGEWIVTQNGGRMRMPSGGYFFDGDWLKFDDRPQDEWIDDCAKNAERIYKETEFFTQYNAFYGYFKEADFEWQCKMLTDPDEIIEEQEILLKENIEHVSKVIKKVGGYIQSIAVGGDLGGQNNPLIRPSVYDDLCAPYLKKFCDFVHENSDYKIFMHSCGAIKPFIQTFIDCGINILNPVQITADGMNPEDLKKEFAGKIAFWGGGCDTQGVLAFKTPDEVKSNVKELVSKFKPGGGFVFNQIHNIMGDVPPENIVAMLEAAYEASVY